MAAGEMYEAFVERYADRTEPMVTLTDEELYVLTAGVAPEDRLLPLKMFDRLSHDEQRIAVRTALRSLTARGTVTPVEGGANDPGTGLDAIEVHGPVVPVLDLLGGAWPLVLLTRQHGGASSTQLLLNLGDRLVLLQDLRAGIHRFWLMHPPTACRQLARALDPTAAATPQREGDSELMRESIGAAPPAEWRHLRARMDGADSAAQLFALRAPELEPRELLLEFAALDDGLVMVTGETPDATGEATEVVARQLSREAVMGLAVHALGLVEVVT